MYNLRLQYPKGDAMNLIAKLLMNSLYGKFAMKLERTEVDIFNCSTDEGKANFKERLDVFGESVQEYLQIDNNFIIVRDTYADVKYDEDKDLYHGMDINIAIGSAITGGARVHMSIFKNNPDFNLYYSDTDSGVTDKHLPAHLIGDGLGQLKFEHVINRAVFLAPKVYGLVDVDGNEIIKAKGITQDVMEGITFNDLEQLLIKNSKKEFNQDKWFKKVFEGEITVNDVIYTLKTTANKRSAIYINEEGLEIYNSTEPYKYDEINIK